MSPESVVRCRSGVSIALLLLLLAACSSTQFVYNRLDTIIGWYIDDYVDLDKAQSKLLAESLDELFIWHRTQELPRYIVFLDTVSAALDTQLDPDTAEALIDEAQMAANRLQSRAVEALLTLGTALTPEQRHGVVDELERRQRDAEKERLSRTDDEYREDTEDRLRENLEDYMGRLNKPQRARLYQAVSNYRRLDGVWLGERAAWIAELGSILRANEPGWPDRVRTAVAERSARWTSGYRADLAHNTQVTRDLLVDLIALRGERQDKRLRRKIAALRADFVALSTPITTPPEPVN